MPLRSQIDGRVEVTHWSKLSGSFLVDIGPSVTAGVTVVNGMLVDGRLVDRAPSVVLLSAVTTTGIRSNHRVR